MFRVTEEVLRALQRFGYPMQVLAHRGIKTRISLAFLTLLVVAIMMGVTGTIGNVISHLELGRIGKAALPAAIRAAEVERMAAVLTLDALVFATDPAPDLARRAAIEAGLARLDKAMRDGADDRLLSQKEALAAAITAILAGGGQVRRAQIEALLNSDGALAESVRAAQHNANETAFSAVDHATRTGLIVAAISTAIFGIGLIVAVGGMWFTRTTVSQPLTHVADVLHRLSDDGQSTAVPYLERHDEIGAIARAAEEFRIALLRQRELEAQATHEREAARTAQALAEEHAHSAERSRHEMERARNYHAKKSAVADAFFTAFSRVVAAAEQGDFGHRIGIRFDDADYDALSTAANEMMAAIEHSLWEVGHVVGDLAAGRLETQMRGAYRGDFAVLKDNVNATAERLRDTVARISETGVLVARDAEALLSTAARQAQHSISQAKAIAVTKTSLEQVTEMISSNVSGADRVATQAKQAFEQARSGQNVVSASVAAMEEIEASGLRVRKIVSVLDEISFQTNLLALNAGVEAARAGEAGKGFMVVAQEVRQLAQRAADAARDIDALVQQSSLDVENGAGLVKSAGAVLDEIVQAVAVVDAAAADITVASREQEKSLRAVGQSMRDLDRFTQEGAGTAAETEAAANRLTAQTVDLEAQLDFFRDETGALKTGAMGERSRAGGDVLEQIACERRREPHVGASLAASG